MSADWVQATSIADLLLRTAARRPEHEALVFPSERFSYAEVVERSIRSARSLAILGVGRGDHVGLLMPNCPEFVFVFFGVQLLGAAAVPLNTRFRTRELGHVIENADLVTLLTSDIVDEHVDLAERLHESLPGLAAAEDPLNLRLAGAPRLRNVVLLGTREAEGMLSGRRFGELAEQTERAHVLREREFVRLGGVALVLFTSGTTAQPKGCLITHEAVTRPWIAAAERMSITEDERAWCPLPMFHMGCLGPMLWAFNLGATLISMTHFEPAAALDQIEQERVTWIQSIFPPISMALIKDPSFRQRDLSHVRGLMNVAPPDTMRLIQAAFAPAVQLSGHFGMTEASGAITCSRWEAPPEEQAEKHGPPLPGLEVRVVDPATAAVLGPGQPGELHVRGVGLFAGYYKDPELTAERVDEDGWLHSGDLGVMDESGNVTYMSRLKDMLKVGGENVAPAEIESHISTLPAVKLVQVVGAPDERLGEVPMAFIELASGHELSAQAVIDHCRGAIASFKVPRYVRFVQSWPMSATKIQKFRLREQAAAEVSSAEASSEGTTAPPKLSSAEGATA